MYRFYKLSLSRSIVFITENVGKENLPDAALQNTNENTYINANANFN